MTIGVIGLGSIGERHVRNLQKKYPRAQIEILTKRTKWSDRATNTSLINSEAAFFKTRHDVYFVTNETGKHTNTIIRALQQKPRGIFIEKPLTASSRDISKIEKAAKNTDVFFVGYCLQFYKPIITIKRILARKTIGDVLSMRVSVGSHLATWRKGDYRKRYSADTRRGGGVVLDLIHELNYPSWLLNAPLRFVAGISDRVSLPIRAEDVSESIFRAKKAIVSIHQDYLRIPARRSCEILGTKGTILWDGDVVTVQTASRTHRITVKEDRNEMYLRELAYFLQKVQSGTKHSNFDEAARDLVNADKIKHAIAQ